MNIKACIFDLDGVIVDTAGYHFIAWRRLANELGFDFTEEENEKLKGVSRIKSLELILKWGDISVPEEKKQELTDRKNSWYVDYIRQMTPAEILDGVVPFLDELKNRGIRIGLGSASKNAPTIIEQVGLLDYFDVMIDGGKVPRGKGKPNPLTFQLGIDALDVRAEECIVFEDAEKGVDAALACGTYVIGIGDEQVLNHAHYVMPTFKDHTFDQVLQKIATISLDQKPIQQA